MALFVVSDYVRSCHDCQCQSRKITKVHIKNAITAYPTPTEPFLVWEVDLYGPLPCSSRGTCNTYIFAAVDMFSKLVFAKPLANKDAATVSEALFDLFTQYGVCDTLISDQGREFTAKVTTEICKLLGIQQQFTPSFVHHCLGACERSHRTLATKLTPFMNAQCNNWDLMTPAIVFSMNNATNSSMGYSPFEVVYAKRPKFPLSPNTADLKSVPKDLQSYISQKQNTLSIIRDEIKKNVSASQTDMLSRENQKLGNLKLSEGDYVYISNETQIAGKKLKYQYHGPLVVRSVPSEHTAILADPDTKAVLPQPVHIDRLKRAFVRQPTPLNYFKVATRIEEPTYSTVATQTGIPENVLVNLPTEIQKERLESSNTRPKRNIQKPKRYRDSDHADPSELSQISSDTENYKKIKRVLAQRHTSDGIQYLVHVVGEPAQNSVWVFGSSLDAKAHKNITCKPPPFV